MSNRILTGDPVDDNTYYRWYAGNHCYPKCTPKKVRECKQKIRELFKQETPQSHKHFVYLIRAKHPICDLPDALYRQNVYRLPFHVERKLHE